MHLRREVPLLLMFVAASLASVGCKKSPRPAQQTLAVGLAPLAAASEPAALAVNGYGPAVVVPPAGATKPMPVVVAVLGIGDTPEEQCGTWKDLVGSRGFVLCPRGAPHYVPDEVDDASLPPDEPAAGEAVSTEGETEKPQKAVDGGWSHVEGYWPVDLATLDAEVTAGLASLKARYPGYVSSSVLYAGFSRGAFLGASLGVRRPATFPRLVLIEGGQSPWQPETAAAFARGGGKRVLFVCGQPSCVEEAELAATTLRAQRVETRVVHGAGEGHGYKKQVKEELRRSFDWAIEGDPIWRELLAR